MPDVRVHGGGISRRVRVLPMRPARLESLQVLDDDRLIYLRLDAPPRLRASGADAGGDDGFSDSDAEGPVNVYDEGDEDLEDVMEEGDEEEGDEESDWETDSEGDEEEEDSDDDESDSE